MSDELNCDRAQGVPLRADGVAVKNLTSFGQKISPIPPPLSYATAGGRGNEIVILSHSHSVL